MITKYYYTYNENFNLKTTYNWQVLWNYKVTCFVYQVASNSQTTACLNLPSARIKGMFHHAEGILNRTVLFNKGTTCHLCLLITLCAGYFVLKCTLRLHVLFKNEDEMCRVKNRLYNCLLNMLLNVKN